MRLKDFNYHLPKNLIAQEPASPRDCSRLLILREKTGKIEHKHFYDIPDYLGAGDVLVVNNTKVMAARLIGKRAETGGKVEVFLLKKRNSILPSQANERDLLKAEFTTSQEFPANARSDSFKKGEIWQCLIGGHRRKENLKVEFEKNLKAEIIKNNLDGTWNVKFNKSGGALMRVVKKIGRVPLPPYIKRDSIASLSRQAPGPRDDAKNYQTVYADEKKLGSVAAPTAGFHFTPGLLKKLSDQGVQIEYVTLQVGLGTFAPVKVDDITKHKMHAEWVEANKKTLENIIEAKQGGRRIIAVGTTSVRTLESIFKNYNFKNCLKIKNYKIKNFSAWTDIFIFPGYKFKIVDGLITNFHLPKSTLLMLISAFAGREKILKVYQEAINKKYRFFSYGDAMLII